MSPESAPEARSGTLQGQEVSRGQAGAERPVNAHSVVLFDNGMVMVCDARGEQIAELQNNLHNQEEAILSRSTEGTEFALSRFRQSYIAVPLAFWLEQYRRRGYWRKAEEAR